MELPPARDTWLRVETAHFTLLGNASEARIREVGLNLERLRAVLLLLTQKLSANAPVPTTVYVFRSDSAMDLYKPLYRGKPASASGYFLARDDGNFIALSAAWNSDPRRVIYHEYLHFFVHNNFPRLPRWYDEGLAEFYSTFQANDTEARIGLVVEEHVGLLRVAPLIPLERFFAITESSPEYNEQSRRGIFYAQAWALVHYLMRGDPEKKPQLASYLAALQRGQPVAEAFRASFRMEFSGLLSELLRYVRGSRFLYTVTKFDEMKISGETKTAKLSREEVLVHLGDLLAQLSEERLDDAEEHFRAVLAEEPAHAAALAGLGEVRMRQERNREALEFFRSAMAAGSEDFRVPFQYGRLLMRALSEGLDPVEPLREEQRSELEEARGAFLRSIERNPEFAEARAALGRTYLMEEGRLAAAGIPHLEAARQRLPSREDLALDLAALYERVGQNAKAEAVLREALGAGAEGMIARKRKESEFRRSLDRVNELLRERREEEAVALLERLVGESSGEIRAELLVQLESLRRKVARNAMAARFDAAIAKANAGDYAGSLAGLDEIARSAEDADLARRAREQAAQIRKYLASRKGKRAPSKSGL
jgi:Tfp pilus assembly protein PilF